MKPLSPQSLLSASQSTAIIHAFDFARPEMNRFVYHQHRDGQEQHRGEHHFNIDDMVFARLNEKPLGELEADLRDVSMALHLADRMALRRPPHKRDAAGLWWHRCIRVKLGVRHVERWNDSAVKGTLEEYLFVNTGDAWELEFVERQAQRTGSEMQLSLGLDAASTWKRRWPHLKIALFSGGLDSLAGLRVQIQQHIDTRFVLVSVDSSSTVRQRQRNLLNSLPDEVRERVEHIAVEIDLHQDEDHKEKTEPSLRTRDLLFLSAGFIVARLTGRDHFFVYENGVGALNLAFDRSQVRGQVTRAVHPQSLSLFGKFATALFRQPLHIENPCLFETKAQLCRALDAPGWRELIAHTFTCGHPQRIKNGGLWHCGACTSCFLRRQGLRAAGLYYEDTKNYLHDLSQPTASLGKHREEWVKVQAQFRVLAHALSSTRNDQEAWRALTQQFQGLRELENERGIVMNGQPLNPVEVRRGILKVLRAYLSEGTELVPGTLSLLPGDSFQSAEESTSKVLSVA